MHRSLCEIEFASKIHYIKGDLFLSPPHRSLISIVHENQGSTLLYSDQNVSKLCLRYHWDIHTDSKKNGPRFHILGNMIFLPSARFKSRSVTRKQHQM